MTISLSKFRNFKVPYIYGEIFSYAMFRFKPKEQRILAAEASIRLNKIWTPTLKCSNEQIANKSYSENKVKVFLLVI